MKAVAATTNFPFGIGGEKRAGQKLPALLHLFMGPAGFSVARGFLSRLRGDGPIRVDYLPSTPSTVREPSMSAFLAVSSWVLRSAGTWLSKLWNGAISTPPSLMV